jgi:hypothetical protein
MTNTQQQKRYFSLLSLSELNAEFFFRFFFSEKKREEEEEKKRELRQSHFWDLFII